MQTEAILEAENLILWDRDRRAVLVIKLILERDDGVEAVVAAGELHDDEDGVFRAGLARRRGRMGRTPEECRHGRAEAEKRRGFQEIASVRHGTPCGEIRNLECGMRRSKCGNYAS